MTDYSSQIKPTKDYGILHDLENLEARANDWEMHFNAKNTQNTKNWDIN